MSETASPPQRKAGRPKAIIDWQHVGELLEAGATAEGVAASIGIDRDTLYNRCVSDNNVGFSAFCQEKRAKGDELLRSAQFRTAMSGNVAMQIWLGKQRLGQADKREVDHTHRNNTEKALQSFRLWIEKNPDAGTIEIQDAIGVFARGLNVDAKDLAAKAGIDDFPDASPILE